MRLSGILIILIITQASLLHAIEPPLISTQAQDEFFNAIKQHCGKSFRGKIVVDNQPSASFTNKALIMHVRECSNFQLKIPFHVGKDASRTWIITKTGSGLSLKHDHRHADGQSDSLTMYGGHTVDSGFTNVQSFPADAPTIEMFVAQGLPQSNTNIWQIYIYPTKFTYRLIREGREFKVDFDLTIPVENPAAPWGYQD
ncbi:MAG: hypothetical protein HWE11_12310 [Gammaproteobacteria bacterium]|nr:hypothetical protein [Gammaproteobacteria bacterium]